MEWVEVAAPSVETAKEIALERLGVYESDVELKIVNEGKVGLFGRVKEEARIRARISPTSGRAKNRVKEDARRAKPSNSMQNSKRGRRRQDGRGRSESARQKSRSRSGRSSNHDRSSRGRRSSAVNTKTKGYSPNSGEKDMHQDSLLSLAEQADLAESFVGGIADIMDISLNFTRDDLEGGVMRIEASGEGIGILIGRRGVTARAIDGLVRTVLQRSGGTTREGKIRVDIGGLRVRKQEALVGFTNRTASYVVTSGEEARLEPMNRLDRKVVHDTVSEIEGVESYSEGNDPMRYVVITTSAPAS